jgi:tyrosine-protein kinase Etk/Wzc
MKPIESDPILFTLADMKRLFIRHQLRIKCAALIGGLAVFLFLLVSAPKYKSEATFKQSKSQKEISVNVKEAFQQFLESSSESATMAVIQSNEVIKTVVEELGMQLECDADPFFAKALKRIGRNLRAEFGGELSDPDKFVFSDVKYSGERPLKMFLKWIDDRSYQLYDNEKHVIAEGNLGSRVSFSLGHLKLNHVPANAKVGKFYCLKISSLIKTVQSLKSHLKIFPHRLDKSILQLTFSCGDRLLGAQFLNRLMLSYHHFLKQENDQICQNQLEYLQKRQEELTAYYDKALQDHASYLNENLAKNGFIGFAQEIETLSEPKNFYTSKLFNVDLDLKRLNGSKESCVLAKEQEGHQLQKPVNRSFLKQAKKKDGQAMDQERKEVHVQLRNCQLEQMRKEASSLQACKEEVLQVQERAKEPMFLDEFSGLSLDTAQNLLVEYTRQRDSLQAQMRELVFLREQLGRPDFEMSSLGGVFDDAVTRDIVNKASAIALQLKDENNRSDREQERLLEALRTHKNFLSHYLFQTVELKKLRVKLLGDKISSLQQATFSLLHTEKNLLQSKLEELNLKMADLPEKWRRESLLMLKKELGAVMLEGISNLVEMKSLGQHTFQISSRPLDSAAPSLTPQPPRVFLKALISALLAGMGCYFVIFSRALFIGLPVTDKTLQLCGFPVSGRVSPYCNTPLSQIHRLDLETLRRVVESLCHALSGGVSLSASKPLDSAISEGIVAVYVGGNYPDFTPPLAELLAMRGLKVIVLQAVFDKVVHANEMPGLWQYLQEQTQDIPIRRSVCYDFVPSGGTCRYGSEILCSPKFQTLLSTLKTSYDIVLIHSSAEPSQMEGFSLLKIADSAVIVVQQESKEQLQVYCKWAEGKRNSCITFVYAEEFG